MSPRQLAELCLLTLELRGAAEPRISLAIPKSWRRPPGFPRGELMCETEVEGELLQTISLCPKRLLLWLVEAAARCSLPAPRRQRVRRSHRP